MESFKIILMILTLTIVSAPGYSNNESVKVTSVAEKVIINMSDEQTEKGENWKEFSILYNPGSVRENLWLTILSTAEHFDVYYLDKLTETEQKTCHKVILIWFYNPNRLDDLWINQPTKKNVHLEDLNKNIKISSDMRRNCKLIHTKQKSYEIECENLSSDMRRNCKLVQKKQKSYEIECENLIETLDTAAVVDQKEIEERIHENSHLLTEANQTQTLCLRGRY
jgi:hypothetical protein